MKDMNEQGFLSDKFDDWSAEPIPNGWGEIEKKLQKDKRRRPLFWWLFPSALLIGGLTFLAIEKFTLPQDANQHMTAVSGSPVGERKTVLREEKEKSGSQVKRSQTIAAVTENKPGQEKAGKDDHQILPSSEPDIKSASVSGKAHEKIGTQSVEVTHPVQDPVLIAEHEDKQSGKSQAEGNQKTKSGSDKTAIASAQFQNCRKSGRNRDYQEKNGQTPPASASVIAKPEVKSGIVLDQSLGLNHQPGTGNESIRSQSAEDGSVSESKNRNREAYSQATDVPYLDIRKAEIQSALVPATPPILTLRELSVMPEVTSENSGTDRKLNFYTGIQSGIGQNTIQIRQSEADKQVQVSNAGSLQTYFLQLSGGLRFQLTSWLEAFSGLQVGVIRQNIQYTTKSKSPERFSMVTTDSVNFIMSPQWSERSESRIQKAVYANVEFGVKPMLFPSRNSGPFAAVSVWSRFYEKNSSDLPGSSPFIPISNTFSLGYRLGYQHEIRKNLLFEAYLSSFPSGIFARTKGITVSPRLVGLGCFYSF